MSNSPDSRSSTEGLVLREAGETAVELFGLTLHRRIVDVAKAT
jgi:hypothetical protein